MIGLRGATFTVRDAAASAALFEEAFGYLPLETGVVSQALAESWGAPLSAGGPYRLCQPASGDGVYIRFVEDPAVAEVRPFTTFGWAAAELCVQDVLSTHARLKSSPFEIIGEPRRLPAIPTIFPMQVKGPDNEIVYLTEIIAQRADGGLPTARVPVDRPFILVLGCRDLSETSDWFRARLNLEVSPPLHFEYELINQAFGASPDTRHWLATANGGEGVCLEFDELPTAAQRRAVAPGALPPGLAIASVSVTDFDALPIDWGVRPWRPDGLLYGGGRLGVARTPDGALLEVVERL
jgi:catechol 2,3-dioxygenase-like lactoylglutathione lyase family enzyme